MAGFLAIQVDTAQYAVCLQRFADYSLLPNVINYWTARLPYCAYRRAFGHSAERPCEAPIDGDEVRR